MCGIAGIIYRDGEHTVGADMTRMLQSMKHRGPDSTGYALSPYADVRPAGASGERPDSEHLVPDRKLWHSSPGSSGR